MGAGSDLAYRAPRAGSHHGDPYLSSSYSSDSSVVRLRSSLDRSRHGAGEPVSRVRIYV